MNKEHHRHSKDEIKMFNYAASQPGGKELIDKTIEALALKINNCSNTLDRLFFYFSCFALLVFLIYRGVINIDKIDFINIRSGLDFIIFSQIVYTILFLRYSNTLYYNLLDRYYFDVLNVTKIMNCLMLNCIARC